MKFFKSIGSSIYSPNYYSTVKNKPFSFSLKYYLLFSLLIAVLSSGIFSAWTIPKIMVLLDVFTEKVLNTYPEELIIDITKGEVSTNVQEPYFIKAPQEWKEDPSIPNSIENVIVIETKTPFSIEKFKEYNALCQLSKENMVCYDKNNTINIMPLDEFPDMTIDKNLIFSFWEKVQPFLNLIYPILFILMLIVFFIVALFRLSYLLIAALFIWIMSKIKKAKIGYKKSYQLGLHLMTLPILFSSLIQRPLNYLGINLTFPFLFTILLLIVAALNLKKANTEQIEKWGKQ